jgi:hypothetical protein
MEGEAGHLRIEATGRHGPVHGLDDVAADRTTSSTKAISRSALAELDPWRLFSTMTKISCAGYRFPPEIIHQAIWLYVRFTLSFRDVEDLLAERGIMVSTRPFGAG